ANPRNLRVPLGISVKELINACGGFNYNGLEPVKILGGGPMMGISMRSLDVPVVKGTSGILALSKFTAHIEDESNCLRCGRCIDACPMRLDPELLDKAVRRRDYKLFEEHLGTNCIECGCCSFICPASRHLTQSLREGKAAVMAARRKAQAQQASQSSKQEAAKK
ncbi:MAG: SLBB domain-containing protein, partial [Synergistaceae bacterium]|nr:SLBB domain-containing protein [Synergistaceae bacterium]